MSNKLELILDIKRKGAENLSKSTAEIKKMAAATITQTKEIKNVTVEMKRINGALGDQSKAADKASKSIDKIGASAKSLDNVKDKANDAEESIDDIGDTAEDANRKVSKLGGNKKLDDLGDSASKANAKFKSAVKGVAMLGAAMAAAAATALVVTMVKVAENIGDMNNLAKKTGVSLQILQGYEPVLKQMGVSVDGFANSIMKLNRTTTAAADYGVTNYAKMYKDLGIEFEKFSEMKPDEQFLKLAEAVNQFDDNQGRAILNRLGLSDLELPIQNVGALTSEMERLQKAGLLMEDYMAESMGAMSDDFEQVTGDLAKFTGILYGNLLPTLQSLYNISDSGEIINRENAEATADNILLIIKFLKLLGGAIVGIYDYFVYLFKDLGYFLAQIIDNVWKSMLDFMDGIKLFMLTNFSDSVKTTFINLGNDIYNFFAEIMNGLYTLVGKEATIKLKAEFDPKDIESKSKEAADKIRAEIAERQEDHNIDKAFRGSASRTTGDKRKGALDGVLETWDTDVKQERAIASDEARKKNEELKILNDANEAKKKIVRDYEMEMARIDRAIQDVKNKAIIAATEEDVKLERERIVKLLNEKYKLAEGQGETEEFLRDLKVKEIAELKRFDEEAQKVKTKLETLVDDINLSKKKMAAGVLGEDGYLAESVKIIENYEKGIAEAIANNDLNEKLDLEIEKKNFISSLNAKAENDIMNSIRNTRQLEKNGEISREESSRKILALYEKLHELQKQFGKDAEANITVGLIKDEKESNEQKIINERYKLINDKIDIVNAKEAAGEIEREEAIHRRLSLYNEMDQTLELSGASELESLKNRARIAKEIKSIEEEKIKLINASNKEAEEAAKIKLAIANQEMQELQKLNSMEIQLLSATNQDKEARLMENENQKQAIIDNFKNLELRAKALNLQDKIFNAREFKIRLDEIATEIETLDDRIAKTSIFDSTALVELQKEKNELLAERLVLEDELNIKKEKTKELELFSKQEVEDYFTSFYEGSFDMFGDFIAGTKSAKDAFEDFAQATIKGIIKIVQQLLIQKAVEATMSAIGGTNYASLFGLSNVPKNHNGGMISDNHNYSAMKGQMKFSGLKDNEALRVLEDGEFVATKKQQENISNAMKGAGGDGGQSKSVTNVMIDEKSLSTSIVKTSEFKQGINEYIQSNKKSINNMLSS